MGDNAGVTKVSRPTFVPEKLNFAAYEKFEGECSVRGVRVFDKRHSNNLSSFAVVISIISLTVIMLIS